MNSGLRVGYIKFLFHCSSVPFSLHMQELQTNFLEQELSRQFKPLIIAAQDFKTQAWIWIWSAIPNSTILVMNLIRI